LPPCVSRLIKLTLPRKIHHGRRWPAGQG
jgi:hypothetical protein